MASWFTKQSKKNHPVQAQGGQGSGRNAFQKERADSVARKGGTQATASMGKLGAPAQSFKMPRAMNFADKASL